MPQRRKDFIWFGPWQPSVDRVADLLRGHLLAAADDRVAAGPAERLRRADRARRGRRGPSPRARASGATVCALGTGRAGLQRRARAAMRRDPPALGRRRAAGDARAVARDRDAGHARSPKSARPPARSRAARRSSDARRRPPSRGSRSAPRPGAAAAGRPPCAARRAPCRTRPRRACPCRRAASAVDAAMTGTLALHLAQQLQALRSRARAAKSGRCIAARSQFTRGVGVEDRLDLARRRAGYCAASSQSSGPQPAITVRPAGTRPDALSSVCARARRHHAGQGPARNRERPLERAGRDDHALRLDQCAPAPRSTRRSRAASDRGSTRVAPLTIVAPLALASRASAAPAQ